MEKLKKISKLNYLQSFLVLLSILGLFLPMGYYFYEGEKSYIANGFQLIFGLKDSGYIIYSFSAIGFILLILLLAIMVMPLLLKFNNKINYIFLIILDLICCILYYCLPIFVIHKRYDVGNLFKGTINVYLVASILVIVIIINIYQLIKFILKNKSS